MTPAHERALDELRAGLETAVYAAECCDASNDLERARQLRSQRDALDALRAENKRLHVQLLNTNAELAVVAGELRETQANLTAILEVTR